MVSGEGWKYRDFGTKTIQESQQVLETTFNTVLAQWENSSTPLEIEPEDYFPKDLTPINIPSRRAAASAFRNAIKAGNIVIGVYMNHTGIDSRVSRVVKNAVNAKDEQEGVMTFLYFPADFAS